LKIDKQTEEVTDIQSAERKDISIKSKAFMSNGVREIISNSDGVKPAYCRTGVTEG
jgi:hypothetical protein